MKRVLVAILCALFLVAISAEAAPATPGDAMVAKKKCKGKKKRAGSAKKKKCKKKRPAPPAPGSGGSTTPPQPPTDPCPGFTVCPATIYQVNQGAFPNGTSVRIANVLVAARMPDGSAFWVEVKAGDPGDAGTNFSGIEVAPGALTAPNPGTRVNVEGIVGTQSLTATQIQPTGAPTEPPGVRTVAPADFANEANEAALNGVFALIVSPGTLSSHVGGDWLMSTGFTVADRIIGTLPTCADGTTINQLVGIADIEAGDLVLLPPEAGAISPNPCP